MIWRRLWYLANRRRIERELAEEMMAHREMMGEPAAFGNAVRLREEAGDVWGWRWLDHIAYDLRHGLRVFRRTPSFALTAIAVLTLGLGLNFGLFQILDASLLAAADLRQPETLIRLRQASRNYSSSGVSFPLTQFVREHNDVLSAVLVMQNLNASWGDDLAEQIPAAFVSSNFFDELGAGAVQGRVLHEGPSEPALVLSHEFWQSRYGGDPRIVGSTIRFNGRPATVAGIATEGFYGPRGNRVHVWAPLEHYEYFYPGSQLRTEWRPVNVDMYARLKPGISPGAAEQALRATVAEAARQHPAALEPDTWLGVTSGITNFRRQQEDREVNTIVALVTGLCLLVLAVACANLASLMIAHISGRAKELQMRAALGAGRGRVMRQLATECSLLVTTGAVLGWFAGWAGARWIAIQTEAPFDIPHLPNWRLTLVAFAFGAVALLGVAIVPAWRTISHRLTAGGGPQPRLQRTLIGVQVFGSCVLLLVAGMAARKLQSVASGDVGFNMDGVAVLDVSLSRYGVAPGAAAAYWRALRDRVTSGPGVQGAALSTYAPMGRSSAQTRFRDAPGLSVTTMTVDVDFHRVLGIPILTGRHFLPGDTRQSAVIVSRRLAERMYGTMDVLGRSYPKSGDGARAVIVGIAADAKLIRITSTASAESYSPMESADLAGAVLIARGEPDVLREAARAVNPAITPAVRWMKADFEKKLLAPRLTSTVATAMGALALALTCFGIFGLIAYTVSLRTKEIGIRVALGALPEAVLWLVLRGLAWPLAIGAALAAPAVLIGLAKVLSGEPLYLDSSDPVAVALSLALLAAAGLLAGYLPAARALRIDPSSALRDE